MLKTILTISALLISNSVIAAWSQAPLRQVVCASIDRNAHDSRWTGRDNTAKVQYKVEYTGSNGALFATANVRTRNQFELHYGDRPHCEAMIIQPYYSQKNKEFYTGNVFVTVQYGGDCKFKINDKQVAHVILRKRSGNLVEPWACRAFF